MQRIHLANAVLRMSVGACLLALCTAGTAQVAPIKRYNTASESLYLLQRCGELNDDRRAWLQRVREDVKRTLDWTPGQWAAHETALKTEFEQQYPAITREKCTELARATDNERKALAQ